MLEIDGHIEIIGMVTMSMNEKLGQTEIIEYISEYAVPCITIFWVFLSTISMTASAIIWLMYAWCVVRIAHAENLSRIGDKSICWKCGSRNVKVSPMDSVANVVCEKSYDCADCEANVDYWAYGYFMSNVYKGEVDNV